jgi:hypothetical protein
MREYPWYHSGNYPAAGLWRPIVPIIDLLCIDHELFHSSLRFWTEIANIFWTAEIANDIHSGTRLHPNNAVEKSFGTARSHVFDPCGSNLRKCSLEYLVSSKLDALERWKAPS